MTHLAAILYSKKGLDICNDSNGPSMFVIPNHPVNKAYKELKERGIRLRFIAEITKDNRHVNFDIDEVRGNGIYYRASAKTKHSSPPPLLICSTPKSVCRTTAIFL